MCAISTPIAIDSFPLLTTLSPIAIDFVCAYCIIGLLRSAVLLYWTFPASAPLPMAIDRSHDFALYPRATEFDPTYRSSHLVSETSPALNAPLCGIHINLEPAPIGGISPNVFWLPSTSPSPEACLNITLPSLTWSLVSLSVKPEYCIDVLFPPMITAPAAW